MVPELIWKGNRWMVKWHDDGQEEFEVRPVRVGEEYGDAVVVLEGVREGELVVTEGAFALKSELERDKIEAAP